MDPSNGIHISVKYSSDDIVSACRDYQSSIFMHRISKLASIGLILAGISWFYLFDFGIVPIFFWVFAVLEWFDALQPIRAWFQYRSNSLLYSETYLIELDESGVHVKSDIVNSHRTWASFESYVDGESNFLLVYGRWTYSTIPKRVLPNKEDEERLRNLIKKKLGGKERRSFSDFS